MIFDNDFSSLTASFVDFQTPDPGVQVLLFCSRIHLGKSPQKTFGGGGLERTKQTKTSGQLIGQTFRLSHSKRANQIPSLPAAPVAV